MSKNLYIDDLDERCIAERVFDEIPDMKEAFDEFCKDREYYDGDEFVRIRRMEQEYDI